MAGRTKTQVCNMALSAVRSKPTISDVETETSPDALACNTWYELAREEILEAHNWTFARRIATLAPHPEPSPDPHYKYRYRLPANCLAPRSIVNPRGRDDDAIPFEKLLADDDTQSIMTNEPNARLRYTSDIENLNLYPSLAIEALAVKLGVLIGGPITAKTSIVAGLGDRLRDLFVVASTMDAGSELDEPERDPRAIRVRSD